MRQSIKTAAGQPHQVRIIGGQWKRTPLPVLTAEGLRPTTDRVRETVFNWLTHLSGNGWARLRCLDLFAGSGALGFEAASRGAAAVTLIENHPAVLRHLTRAKDKLSAHQVHVLGGDVLVNVRQLIASGENTALFDVIFVDPPYHMGWLEKIMPLCGQLLSENGLVYVEAELPLTGELLPPWMVEWDVVRADKAGMVFYHVLQRKKMPEMGHNARSV